MGRRGRLSLQNFVYLWTFAHRYDIIFSLKSGGGTSVKRFLKKYMMAVIVTLCVIAIYGVMFALEATCPVKYLTGVSCPGCGMTRACLSALRFDFESAFYYHPLWILMLPLAALLIFLWAKRKKKAFCAVLGLFFVALIGVYLYRLLFLESDVVVWELEK